MCFVRLSFGVLHFLQLDQFESEVLQLGCFLCQSVSQITVNVFFLFRQLLQSLNLLLVVDLHEVTCPLIVLHLFVQVIDLKGIKWSIVEKSTFWVYSIKNFWKRITIEKYFLPCSFFLTYLNFSILNHRYCKSRGYIFPPFLPLTFAPAYQFRKIFCSKQIFLRRQWLFFQLLYEDFFNGFGPPFLSPPTRCQKYPGWPP